MSEQQLLSADPSAGLLSTDPRAGVVPPPLPPQGYYENRAGERIPQSEITIGARHTGPAQSAAAQRIASEGDWQWHPPGVAPGQDATAQRVDSNIIGGTQGGGIAPEDLLAGGMAGRAIVGAARSSGAGAAVTEAIAQASPYVKFTVAKHTLEAAGVPAIIAEPAAYFISGYRRGKPTLAEPGPVDPAAPHLDRSIPVQPGALTQEQIAERVFRGQGIPSPAVEKPPLGQRVRTVADVIAPDAPPAAAPPTSSPSFTVIRDGQGNIAGLQRVKSVADVLPPDVVPVQPAAAPPAVPGRPAASGAPLAAPPSTPESSSPAPRPANTLPDQKALNEAALAARRAAYQARQAEAAASDAAAKGQPQPAPARPKLTAAESKEFLRLRQTMTDPQAMEAIQAARDFQAKFGLSSPTPTETKFPKR